MKRNNIFYTAGLAAVMGLSLASCDNYLDVMPDNRTEVDTEDKVAALLTSAYPAISSYVILNEVMSDQCDDLGDAYNSYTQRFVDQAFRWQDVTEETNDSPEMYWTYYYQCAAAANQALQSIEEMGGPTTTKLKECKAEALLCRAYAHFMLANEFCMAYDPTTASTDLGITYSTEPETKLNPTYTRGTLAEVYEHIDADIQEALPMIGDTHYSVPKYHFNTQAAYAFAARFYLFYQKWDKTVEYANKVLGNNPTALLRDWAELQSWSVSANVSARGNVYINAAKNCNLLISSTISSAAFFNSNYTQMTKYAHNEYLSQTECANATNIWGNDTLICEPLVFRGGAMNRALIIKYPAGTDAFYVIDEVSGSGYFMTTSVPFKADELLLERAEAYVMLGENDKACADLTYWMQNFVSTNKTLTPEMIKTFYDNMNYYTWDAPTLKRHLQPTFSWDGEGSLQEAMLHCVLNFKRIEGVHEGFRWWDNKRYGMTICHRVLSTDLKPMTLVDVLQPRDPRYAIQLPASVISAGLEANPR